MLLDVTRRYSALLGATRRYLALLGATRRYSEFDKNHDLKLVVFRERRWENRLIHVLCESVAMRRRQEHDEGAF
jgi:hypothetical protein